MSLVFLAVVLIALRIGRARREPEQEAVDRSLDPIAGGFPVPALPGEVPVADVFMGVEIEMPIHNGKSLQIEAVLTRGSSHDA